MKTTTELYLLIVFNALLKKVEVVLYRLNRIYVLLEVSSIDPLVSNYTFVSFEVGMFLGFLLKIKRPGCFEVRSKLLIIF